MCSFENETFHLLGKVFEIISNYYLRTTENTAALFSFDRLMLSSIREHIIYVIKTSNDALCYK